MAAIPEEDTPGSVVTCTTPSSKYNIGPREADPWDSGSAIQSTAGCKPTPIFSLSKINKISSLVWIKLHLISPHPILHSYQVLSNSFYSPLEIGWKGEGELDIVSILMVLTLNPTGESPSMVILKPYSIGDKTGSQRPMASQPLPRHYHNHQQYLYMLSCITFWNVPNRQE